MCFFSAPKIPAPPQAAQFQAQKLPDNASDPNAQDDIRRRRAMAATAFTGALGLGNPASTTTALGG